MTINRSVGEPTDIIVRMSAVGLASLTTVMILLAAIAFGPDVWRVGTRGWQRRRSRRDERAKALQRLQDPGETLRSERRAERQLLEALGPASFEAYRALGFLHVFGSDGRHGYLIYPHAPIVSFDVLGSEPLDEYSFAAASASASVISDAADVLAKWEALMADEGSVVSPSNMHLLGRDVEPARVRRDLIRLSEWTSRRPPAPGENAARPLRQPQHPHRGQTNS